MSKLNEQAPIEKAGEILSATENFDPLRGEPALVRFENRSIIGEGGMGTVYKAYDPVLERTVVIKVLKQQGNALEKSVARFERESRALAALSHNNIVTVHLCGFLSSGLPFMVMDYVEGMTLHDYLQNNKTRSWQELLLIFTQVLNALNSAHELSIIHRDLKPENIMIGRDETGLAKQDQTSSGNSYIRVRLLDFGVAKIATEESDQKVTATAAILGTPRYMSPEQCIGHPADQRSDLYSLACIMYEYITGAVPFESENLIQMLYQRAHEDSSSPSCSEQLLHCSPELKAFLLKALAKSPEHRFQAAEEMLKEMQAIPDSPVRFADPKPSRKASARTLLWVLPIILILGAILLITKNGSFTGNKLSENGNHQSTSFNRSAEFNKGDNLESERHYTEAFNCFQNALTAARRKRDTSMEYESLRRIGILQLDYLKQTELAVRTFQELVELSKKFSSSSDKRFRALELLAKAYHRTGESKEALQLLEDANRFRRGSRVHYEEAYSCFSNEEYAAQIYFELGDKKEAERLLNKHWKLLIDADPHNCNNLEDGVTIVKNYRNGGEKEEAKKKMRELLNFMKEPLCYEERKDKEHFLNDAIAESEALGLASEAKKLKSRLSNLKE